MPDQEGSYLAEPSGPGRGGVLVVHDWYGLLPHVRTLCDELAAAGLVATAPDLYDGRTASLARHRALVRQRRRGPVRPNPGRRGLVDHGPIPPPPPGFAVAQRRPEGTAAERSWSG